MRAQTKQELINTLESLYTVYTGVSGYTAKKSDSKAIIQNKINYMYRAIAWRKYANKLHTAIVNEYGNMWVYFAPQESIEKLELVDKKATSYWRLGY